MSEPHPPSIEAEGSATLEMVRSLRAQIAERERNRQQIGLLSGGTIAAAISVIPQANVSNWLVLGLSILLLAFAFTMLNYDYRVIVAASFIIDEGGADGPVQLTWERRLHSESKDPGPPLARAVRWMRVSAAYGVAVFGALGALGVFLHDATSFERVAALCPMALAVAFIVGVRDLTQRYADLVK